MTEQQFWSGGMDNFYRHLIHYQNMQKQKYDDLDLLAWNTANYMGVMLDNVIIGTYQVDDKTANRVIKNKNPFPKLPNRMLKEEENNPELTEKEKKLERERMYNYFKGMSKKSS